MFLGFVLKFSLRLILVPRYLYSSTLSMAINHDGWWVKIVTLIAENQFFTFLSIDE